MIKDKTLRLITIIMSHTVEWLLVVACIELSSVGTDRPAKLNAATTHEQMAQKYQTELVFGAVELQMLQKHVLSHKITSKGSF